MPTIEQLQKAILKTINHPQFNGWFHQDGLQGQILELKPNREGLYWLWWTADVSGGCKQASAPATTQII